jgi:hypothetical protein
VQTLVQVDEIGGGPRPRLVADVGEDALRQRLQARGRLDARRGLRDVAGVEPGRRHRATKLAPRTFFRYFPANVDVLFADHEQLVGLIRDTLATRPPDEPIIDALRRAVLQGVEQVAADPSLFLTRSRLAASVPAAAARSRYLDADYEDATAEAVAAIRRTDAATDVYARVVARAAWGANRAARDVWVATGVKRDPRSLVNVAFDVLGDCLRSDDASATRPEANVAAAHDGAAASS